MILDVLVVVSKAGVPMRTFQSTSIPITTRMCTCSRMFGLLRPPRRRGPPVSVKACPRKSAGAPGGPPVFFVRVFTSILNSYFKDLDSPSCSLC